MSKVIDVRIQQIQRLIEGTICKMESKANADPNEPRYREEYRKYKYAIDGLDDVVNYKGSILVEDILSVFPDKDYSWGKQMIDDLDSLNIYLKNKPIEREKILNNIRTGIINDYVEYNPYYRMLMGVPAYDTPESEYVYVYVPNTDGEIERLPIHKLTRSQIYHIKLSGLLDTIIANNPDKPYIRYIDKGISLVEAREAGQFQILWTPQKREFNLYREAYNKERKAWLATYSSEWLNNTTDFNESIELTVLKLRAVIYFFIYSYSNVLDKTSFTKAESETKFKEFGLNFPSRIPDSYRDTTTFVLNYLDMFKGTNFVVNFIAKKLFKGLRLYKYWIRKRKNTQSIEYEYPKTNGVLDPPKQIFKDGSVYGKFNGDVKNEYIVEYILRPIESTNPIDYTYSKVSTGLDSSVSHSNHATSVLPYINTTTNADVSGDVVLSYDDMSMIDPRWEDSEEMKEAVYSEDFSYVETKYIGLDNIVKITDFTVALGVVHRSFIKVRPMLERTKLEYSTTSNIHSFFSLWMYYMAMINYLISFSDGPIGDTLIKPKSFYGFESIKVHPTIRMYWLIVFAQYDIDVTLEEFPDPLNNSVDFLNLLKYVEKSIGLAKFFEMVMTKATNLEEVDMIEKVYRIVRVDSKKPEIFGYTENENGTPFIKYLEEHDAELLYLYKENLISGNIDDLMVELDNLVTFFIKTVESYEDRINGEFPEIRESLFMSNMMYGGVSKYLLYILQLFKAWRTEFINDGGVILTNGDDDEYLLQVHQITPKVNITIPLDRMNTTQYHWLEQNEEYDTDINDVSRTSDNIFQVTRYGDILIS